MMRRQRSGRPGRSGEIRPASLLCGHVAAQPLGAISQRDPAPAAVPDAVAAVSGVRGKARGLAAPGCYGLLLLRLIARIVQSCAGDTSLCRRRLRITQLLARELCYTSASVCILSHGISPFWHCHAERTRYHIHSALRKVYSLCYSSRLYKLGNRLFRLVWTIQPGRFSLVGRLSTTGKRSIRHSFPVDK